MPIERLSSFSWQNASFKSIIRALEKCVPNLRRRISLPCWRTDLTPIEIMSWFMGPNARNEETNSWKSLWSWCKILVMLVFAFKMEFFFMFMHPLQCIDSNWFQETPLPMSFTLRKRSEFPPPAPNCRKVDELLFSLRSVSVCMCYECSANMIKEPWVLLLEIRLPINSTKKNKNNQWLKVNNQYMSLKR